MAITWIVVIRERERRGFDRIQPRREDLRRDVDRRLELAARGEETRRGWELRDRCRVVAGRRRVVPPKQGTHRDDPHERAGPRRGYIEREQAAEGVAGEDRRWQGAVMRPYSWQHLVDDEVGEGVRAAGRRKSLCRAAGGSGREVMCSIFPVR